VLAQIVQCVDNVADSSISRAVKHLLQIGERVFVTALFRICLADVVQQVSLRTFIAEFALQLECVFVVFQRLLVVAAIIKKLPRSISVPPCRVVADVGANLQRLLVIRQSVLVLAKRNLCRGKFIQAQSIPFFCPMLRRWSALCCWHNFIRLAQHAVCHASDADWLLLFLVVHLHGEAVRLVQRLKAALRIWLLIWMRPMSMLRNILGIRGEIFS